MIHSIIQTFTSVAKMNIVMVILSLVANYNWNLNQFDVNVFFMEILKKRSTWLYPLDTMEAWTYFRQHRVQVKKGFIWTKAITTSMVWEIH